MQAAFFETTGRMIGYSPPFLCKIPHHPAVSDGLRSPSYVRTD
jgi:hypothetical protein